jgi:hypothetical protein
MIFGKKTRLEEYLIELLDQSSLEGPRLLVELATLHPELEATKQAVYKALRKLMHEEVVTRIGNSYSLNRYWLQKIREFSQRHISEPRSTDVSNILEFENGDAVTYHFKNPYLLDVTWAHIYDIVYEANPVERVVLNYHPHEWLMLSRPESERFWLSRFAQDKKIMWFSIGGGTFLDKKFQQENGSDYVQVNLNESYGLKPNQYLAVVGDYVFEITTDEVFEKRVHELFENVQSENEIDQEKILTLSKQKYRAKLKLSKHKKKADAWRRRFNKNFYAPKPYYLFDKR